MHRETRLGLVAVFAVLFGVTSMRAAALDSNPPSDNIIGVFADPEGAQCNISAPVMSSSRMYLLAIDRSNSGTYGVEFRVDGFPPEWTRVITPSPAIEISLGNPLAGGCYIAFTSCIEGGATLLYTIDFVATTEVVNRTLRVDRHAVCFQCWGPLWVLCDAPVFTKVTLAPFDSYLNGTQDPCLVAVEPGTWSQVKVSTNSACQKLHRT